MPVYKYCEKCGGSGVDHYEQSSAIALRAFPCDECNGTGQIKLVLSNGDKLRNISQMDDEELAVLFRRLLNMTAPRNTVAKYEMIDFMAKADTEESEAQHD